MDMLSNAQTISGKLSFLANYNSCE